MTIYLYQIGQYSNRKNAFKLTIDDIESGYYSTSVYLGSKLVFYKTLFPLPRFIPSFLKPFYYITTSNYTSTKELWKFQC